MAKLPSRKFLSITGALLLTCLLTSLTPTLLRAQPPPARFDLIGPKIEVRVTRAGKTLPIAYVPNLQPADKLWLHPDLPPTQSVHLLLIVAFLRGTTNPPPDDWFVKIETWNRKVSDEGVSVTVPGEAQEAILFLAPETGGDFATLKKAVRGRPGIFVRASQDLSQAGFEQARIEKYVASMRQVPPSDPKALLEHSTLLARTLNLRPNDDCFKRPVDMQYDCLTQSGNQTLLDDGHAQNTLATLSNGSNSDFITAASYTNLAGGGTYSAYVGAAVDLFRILGGLHSAQYQYIPAIAFPEAERLNLRLNTAPSFRNPKSVIVIGLPAIRKAVPPPLRPADPKLVACLLKPNVVLPIEGAPLVFSTSFAHDLVLHVPSPTQSPTTPQDIPLTPDAFQGGLVVTHPLDRRPLPLPAATGSANSEPPNSTQMASKPPGAKPVDSKPNPNSLSTPSSSMAATQPSNTITGVVKGSWGFDTFIGPTVSLEDLPGVDWKLTAADALIAGRENHVLLASTGTACVESIRLEAPASPSTPGPSTPNPSTVSAPASGSSTPTLWKPTDKPNQIDVSLPLKSADPGDLHITIQQFGEPTHATVTTKMFVEPATLTRLQLHAGDTSAVATGTNLAQVQQMTVANLTFTPAAAPTPAASSSENKSATATPETLRMTLPAATPSPKVRAGEKLSASITLKDGRTLVLPVTVEPERPVVTLLSRNMGRGDSNLHLTSEDDLPASHQLTFSLRSTADFPRAGKIEIANLDESLHADLSVAAGSLVLQNPRTLLGTFDPFKAFGTSAFGPLRLRAVAPDGTAGDWLPIANLVRLPTLTSLRCPTDIAAPCTLSGSDLYLLESVATDTAFTTPTPVPEGYVDSNLTIPRPPNLPPTPTRTATTTLYLHLRDDPAPPNSATLPVLPPTP